MTLQVLVTGATGFLGAHVVTSLQQRGHAPRALVRKSSNARDLAEAGVPLVRAEYDDPSGIDRALQGADVVIHCAGGGKVGSPGSLTRANVDTTRALLEGARRRITPPKFVLVSSLAAQGPAPGRPLTELDPPAPVSDYGKSKLAAEQLCWSSKDIVPVVILRPPAVYGPADTRMVSLFHSVSRGWLPLLAGGAAQTSLVYGPDCAEALVRLAESPIRGELFYVSDGERYTQAQLGDEIARALNKQPRRLVVPKLVLGVAGWSNELFGRLRGEDVVLSRDKVRDLVQDDWTLDPSKLVRALDWSPPTLLRQGIERAAHWYRQHGWIPA